MRRLELTTEAEEELRSAATWYERRVPGLGRECLSAVGRTMESIASNPQLFQTVHRDLRRALVRRFPYGVFFRVVDETSVVVVAILHLHRDPEGWMAR